jgi:hypothetical protein
MLAMREQAWSAHLPESRYIMSARWFPQWAAIPLAVFDVIAVTIITMMVTFNAGVQDQKNADTTCQVAPEARVASTAGIRGSVLSDANECVFASALDTAVAIFWRPDPQGTVFKRSLAIAPVPTFSLVRGITAAPLLREIGVYFDATDRMYVVEGYGDVPMSKVVAVARLVATHR